MLRRAEFQINWELTTHFLPYIHLHILEKKYQDFICVSNFILHEEITIQMNKIQKEASNILTRLTFIINL